MVLSWIRDYQFGASDGSSFGVSAGDGKVGVGNSTTNPFYQKIYCWLNDDDNFM